VTAEMTQHTIGTREEWLAAREQLLIREKEHTRLGDELAQLRRELPWVPVEKEYRLDTESMDASLPPGRHSPGSRLSVATRQATAQNPAAGRLLAAIVSSRSISTSLISSRQPVRLGRHWNAESYSHKATLKKLMPARPTVMGMQPQPLEKPRPETLRCVECDAESPPEARRWRDLTTSRPKLRPD
jgi:Bacterial protein of unknown function (DUF899)